MGLSGLNDAEWPHLCLWPPLDGMDGCITVYSLSSSKRLGRLAHRVVRRVPSLCIIFAIILLTKISPMDNIRVHTGLDSMRREQIEDNLATNSMEVLNLQVHFALLPMYKLRTTIFCQTFNKMFTPFLIL